jgi:large subunit ribosomal protein L30
MGWMIVRVRGTIHARHDIVDTLRILHLTRANHATVVPERAEFRGMITRVQGYVTWGEADPKTVGLLLEHRGVTDAGGSLTPEAVQAVGGAKDLNELAVRVTQEGLPPIAGLRPLFRLTPPKGGWRSTKKPYARGGALGYRGAKINELVQRMV